MLVYVQFAGFMAIGMLIMLIFGIVVVVIRNKVRYDISLSTHLPLSGLCCTLYQAEGFPVCQLNGLSPSYLSEHPHTPSRPLRSADQLLLKLELIRQASSLSRFKSLLKTHLFSLAFNVHRYVIWAGQSLFIYEVLLCLFYCTALWEPLCLFELCFMNKMDWIGYVHLAICILYTFDLDLNHSHSFVC